ncbi:hypothetical protein Q4566_05835 [Tamlana sp. 2_MG-2023]|uniref:hypothetical protein n=1 Tax=unclassified Tamlana TaxID=2614803 RepID=UPI0026E1DF2B|nr:MULTISPECIES: hypothetical protein [unclassified Tamlana]MDO6759714.1 hypothetical protein [Tamlana sp. 2_MG-2023]MDO6791337.1 hypothetical protein [Tamlana sp. 1_MG-2023]
MSYQEDFVLFWEQVKESVQEGRFAKLTMAKTIGKPDLKNIFLRPLTSEGDFKVLLKFRYRLKETEDVEEELTLEQALNVIKPHLKKSFLTVLLFTTTKDVTFKINKKGVGSITEGAPTFQDVRLADRDM